MDVIDRQWLLARLTGRRGEQTELAQAMGIDTDKMSKVIAGKRRIQPEEIPRVMAFFGVIDDDVDPELAEVWRALQPSERAFLLSIAKLQISSRDQPLETESSADE
ncbi:MAG: helix-turn-helix transcriptional regulator [Pseudomonadota bacterium]